MLKVSWIEIFLRLIPEMLILIWGIYVVTDNSLNKKSYILSSVIIGITTFFIRMLPIYFGVHTMIILVLTISAMVISNISIIKAIYGTVLMFFVLSFSEFLNLSVLNLLQINTDLEFINPFIKSVMGIPSLAIASLIILILRYLITTREGSKNVSG